VKRADQSGFTLVELTLAMAIFSFALIIFVSGFQTIMKLYQTGLAMRDTQQSARIAINRIVVDARGSSSAVVGAATTTTVQGGTTSVEPICLFNSNGMIYYYVDSNGDLYRNTYKVTEEPPQDLCPSAVNGAPPSSLSLKAGDGSEAVVKDISEGGAANGVRVALLNATATPTTLPQGSTTPQDLNITIGVAGDTAVNNGELAVVNSTLGCNASFAYCSVTNLSTDVSLQGGTQ